MKDEIVEALGFDTDRLQDQYNEYHMFSATRDKFIEALMYCQENETPSIDKTPMTVRKPLLRPLKCLTATNGSNLKARPNRSNVHGTIFWSMSRAP